MKTQTLNKIDYRKASIVIDSAEREDIKSRAYKIFDRGQITIANILKVSPENVNMAFAGKNMKLMVRIKQLVLNYEKRLAA